MKPLSIRDIAAAAGTVWQGGDLVVSDVCTDTRKLTPGCLFVALLGDRFNGHDYIAKALEEGAVAVLSEQFSSDPRVMRVKDTRAGLLAVAGFYRRDISPKVVAVTGSVGKTTTKEMTSCVLESTCKTLKTPKNLNNEVGLSHTIFLMEEDTRAAVLELGVDGPGQMAPLSRCAAPDVGIVTGIGITHMERFGSREDIRREKLLIRTGMPDGAVLLICGDNDLLCTFKDPRLRVLRYGFENTDCEIRAVHLEMHGQESCFDILWEGKRYPAKLPAAGVHNVVDALAAFGAGVLLGVAPQEAAASLEGYRPQGMRQKIIHHNGFTVVEDCYNAAPESMRAALTTLAHMNGGRKIAILSDMLELGKNERAEHKAIGAFAAKAGIDYLLCTGPLSEEYVLGAAEAGFADAKHYPDQGALLKALGVLAQKDDVIWVKGSRGMHLEHLLEMIYLL